MKRILIAVLFLLVVGEVLAQHSSNAYRTLADSLFVHHHYQRATDYYQKALKKSPDPGGIMLRLAKCYYRINLVSESEKWFIKAKQHHGSFSTSDYYEFARVLMMLNKKYEADTLLVHVLQKHPDNLVVRKELDDLRNFQKYYKDSASFAIQKLLINTEASEFAPVFYKDGIVFSSSRQDDPFKKKSHWDNSPFLNLYYSPKTVEQGFVKPTLFEDDLDTRHHDGPAMFYAQYQKMIINRNQRVEMKGKKNVFEWRPGLYDAQLDRAKTEWQVVPLPFNNPAHAYLHPSISEDGTVLYFASDQPGGYGGTDIYRVVRSNDVWGIPINVGSEINTEEDEAFPFFIGNTLYFTSNGHGGLGGLDIFKSEQIENEFTPPVNLGYPINSTADDFSMITDAGQRNGYFASSRHGNDDLFSFEKLATYQVLAIGIVKNTSDELVDGYRATVKNRNTGAVIPVQAEKGSMTFIAERGDTYDISVEHENYETTLQALSIPLAGPETEKFTVILKNKSNEAAKLLVLDTEVGTSKMYVKTEGSLNEITEKDNLLYLTTPLGIEYLGKGNISDLRTDPTSVLKEFGMQKSDRTNLRNIYFDFDMATLDDQDIAYLNQVKGILEHDRSLKLLVAGHADDRGEEDYNVKLSVRRVQAVTKYLISQGIPKARIIEKAYGESLPVIPCHSVDCSEGDHQKNRRAEFVLRYNGVNVGAPPLSKTLDEEESSHQR